MAIWSADVTTEDGALGATGLAGVACFILAGLAVAGLWFGLGLFTDPARAAAFLIGAVFELVLFVIAGFRFRAGKGFVWGIVAAVVLGCETLAKLSQANIGGLIIDAICLIVIVNGIRGAKSLRKGIANSDEEAAIFS